MISVNVDQIDDIYQIIWTHRHKESEDWEAESTN